MRPAVLLLITAMLLNASTITIPGAGVDPVAILEVEAGTAMRSVGQVFVVPTPTNEFVLTSFSFETLSVSLGIDYRGYVYEWDSASSRAKGSALYSSAPLTGLDVPAFFGLSLALTPNTQYIAFVTTQGVRNDVDFDIMVLRGNGSNPYTPASAYWQVSSAGLANTASGSWTTEAWTSNTAFDLQFEATFVSDVPEPSTVGLAAIGMVVIAAQALQRRHLSRR